MAARRRHPTAPTTWDSAAACRDWPDPDDFFPNRGDELDAVLSVCRTCPIARPCGDRGLQGRERYGIWGGLTERDRERIWEGWASGRSTTSSTVVA